MSRPRMAKRKHLTGTNIIVNRSKGREYWYWRNPHTGKRFPLNEGTQADKIEAARILNERIRDKTPAIDKMVERAVSGRMTVRQLIEEFDAKVVDAPKYDGKPRSKTTIAEERRKLHYLCKRFGDREITDIRTKDLRDYCNECSQGVRRATRSVIYRLFQHAYREEYVPENVADRLPSFKEVKQRQRLEAWMIDAVLKHPDCPTYLANAIEFARVSLLRRSDLVLAERGRIENGYMHVHVQKTGVNLKIKMGPTMERVIQRCQDDVCSPFIIHRPRDMRAPNSRDRHKLAHWSQLHPHTLSMAFTELRNSIPEIQKMPAKTRPSFHEIRALGALEYEQAGFSVAEIQALLGHSTEGQTRKYLADHNERWILASSM